LPTVTRTCPSAIFVGVAAPGAQPGRHPRGVHLVGLRRHRHRGAWLLLADGVVAGRAADLDHHLGHLALDRLQRGREHLLRLDAAGIDVVVFDLDDRLPEDVEAGEVVVLVLERLDSGVGIAGAQGPAVAGERKERKDERSGDDGEAN
jgi:hypothetical protein